MNRSALLSACLAVSVLACSERPSGATVDAGAPPVQAAPEVPDSGAPEPEAVDAGLEDAGAQAGAPASPDAGSAACSAGTLSAKTLIPIPPPPPLVEGMRRRIIAAAVACDYAALAKLADANGKGLRFSFGDGKDPAAAWRKAEQEGEPVLARMVQVLNLSPAKQGDLYFWPAVHVTGAEKDWQAVVGVYPEKQLRAMKEGGTGYLGLRVGISAKGDWQLAVSGD
ncbi:hypothetical protein [Pyxidicoccus caerfyrddinensis]|uniref:hypothetical protein n=1 Tax=Pyxidicoccus caerfyrddinensis TaxID=2709663 RepID=UPI001F087535|nr:hypothetical protein [Pyxidicoccus caerfyrddinensis]